MKFRGATRKKRIRQAIVALFAILLGDREVAIAQDPIPSDPSRPRPETEKVISANPWRTAVKLYTFKGHITGIGSLAFSSNSQTLISGGTENDGSLRFWSMEEGEEDAEFRAQRTNVQTMAVTPDGKTLVTSGPDAIINLWDLVRGKEYREFRTSFLEHSSQVLSVAISPDSRVLVSGALDGIRVWSLSPRRPIYRLSWIGDPVYAVAFNPNGYIVASGDGNGKVQFWDVREGTFISEFFPHQEAINAMAFTPDGKILMTASNDRTVKVWNLETGKLVNTLVGHPDKVRAIALNPDGRTLATASNDGIRLWDIFSGDIVGRYYGHKDWVTALAFSPDGRYLASGGLDSLVNVWEASTGDVNPASEEEEEEEEEETEE
jgi:WD40 repeat protein